MAAPAPPHRKRFGQHFLHERGVIERIVAAVRPLPGDRLVEIGPGRGSLTRALLSACGGRIDTVEIDRDLVAALRADLAATDARLVVHQADALEFDFNALAAARGGPLRVV